MSLLNRTTEFKIHKHKLLFFVCRNINNNYFFQKKNLRHVNNAIRRSEQIYKA